MSRNDKIFVVEGEEVDKADFNAAIAEGYEIDYPEDADETDEEYEERVMLEEEKEFFEWEKGQVNEKDE